MNFHYNFILDKDWCAVESQVSREKKGMGTLEYPWDYQQHSSGLQRREEEEAWKGVFDFFLPTLCELRNIWGGGDSLRNGDHFSRIRWDCASWAVSKAEH